MVFNPAVGASNDVRIIVVFAFIRKACVRQDGEAEGAALSLFGFDPNVAAVSIDNRFAEVQSESGAANLRAVTMIAIKFVEQVVHGIAGHADAKVLYGSLHQTIL